MHKTGRACQTAFLIHVLSFVASRGRNPTNHVSHLCDRRNCFNPEHLQDETAVVNNSRKGCPGPIFCADHGHELVDLCAHSPKCIRPPNENTSCCLAIRDSDPLGWSQMQSSTTQTKSFSRQHSRTDSNVSNRSGSQASLKPKTVKDQAGVKPSQTLKDWQRARSASFDGAKELEAALKEGSLTWE
jgi:hypothetical protein